MLIIRIKFIVEPNKKVLGFNAAHYASEQAGLAGAIPSQNTRNLTGLGGYESASQYGQLAELKMHAINQHGIYIIR
jgi:hypothetical protein